MFAGTLRAQAAMNVRAAFWLTNKLPQTRNPIAHAEESYRKLRQSVADPVPHHSPLRSSRDIRTETSGQPMGDGIKD
jgi:hypothetical protein